MIHKTLITIPLLIFLVCLCSAQSDAPQGKDSQERIFYLTVSDERGYINGLDVSNLKFEINGKPQEIGLFNQLNEPVSFGFLIDVSGSMTYSNSNKGANFIDEIKSLKWFVESQMRNNDYFIVTFGREVQTYSDTTDNKQKVLNDLNNISTGTFDAKETKFYDAIYLGLEKIAKSKYRKKVLIVLSDGKDNGSRKDSGGIKKSAKIRDVFIYGFQLLTEDMYSMTDRNDVPLRMRSVPLFLRDYRRMQFFNSLTAADAENSSSEPTRRITMGTGPGPDYAGRYLPFKLDYLEEIVSETGGRMFYPADKDEVSQSFKILSDELSSQYKIVIRQQRAKERDKLRVYLKPNPTISSKGNLNIRLSGN